MDDVSVGIVDRLRRWGRFKAAASGMAFAGGLLVLIFGIAVGGPVMVGYFLAGVLPFALGLAALVHGMNTAESASTASAQEPLDELKRRYAAGEIEDETLERKVETLLDADGRSPRRTRTDREREPERMRR